MYDVRERSQEGLKEWKFHFLHENESGKIRFGKDTCILDILKNEIFIQHPMQTSNKELDT